MVVFVGFGVVLGIAVPFAVYFVVSVNVVIGGVDVCNVVVVNFSIIFDVGSVT